MTDDNSEYDPEEDLHNVQRNPDGTPVRTQVRFNRISRRKSPLTFEQMTNSQKSLFSLLMMFVENSDPGNEDNNKNLAQLLGFGEDVKGFNTWRTDQENSGWNWKGDETRPGIDFNNIAPGKATANPNLARDAQRYIDTGPPIKIGTGERQQKVMSVLNDAAEKAGISARCLAGIWGVESGFGKGLCSSTGCQGDFQFTHRTFDSMMAGKSGDRIAAALRASGHEKEALEVESYKTGDFKKLSNDPIISTYAAAFYMKDTARTMGVDPLKQESWGKIYAAYNIGAYAAKRLTGDLADTGNVGSQLGMVAAVNPGFFKGGATGTEAMANYQRAVERNASAFNNSFSDAVVATNKTPGSSGTVVASTDPKKTPGPGSNA